MTNNNIRTLPPDIQPSWLNVVRRLQSAASEANSYPAFVSITVLVDEYGHPRLWTEPRCTKMEPKQHAVDRLNDISDGV